ncbi:MAG TPA: hypothetical protein VHO47_00935 [Candidatus Babeliales bacterium]|nr:hypothetical protein [Candidatus Babeliales bacterium]
MIFNKAFIFFACVLPFSIQASIDWRPIVDHIAHTHVSDSSFNKQHDIWIDSHLYTIRVKQEPLVQCSINDTYVNVLEKTVEILEGGIVIERMTIQNNVVKNYSRHSVFSKFAYGIVWGLCARFALQFFFNDNTISPEAKGWIAGAYGFGAALSLD